MKLQVKYNFLPKLPTVKASQLQQLYGIDFDHGEHILIDDFEVEIQPQQIILLTGDSGSGKSSLLKQIQLNLSRENPEIKIVNLNSLNFDHRIILEQTGLEFSDAVNLFSQCGLAEPRLLLRTPFELSDGQRYRFLLALALAKKPDWIIADEFCANLDRTLAKVLSFNLQKLSARQKTGMIFATTHDDLVDDLAPHSHLHCRLGYHPELITRNTAAGNSTSLSCVCDKTSPHENTVKKKSRSHPKSGSPQVPNPIGRTFLRGITEVTTSASPDSLPSSGIMSLATQAASINPSP